MVKVLIAHQLILKIIVLGISFAIGLLTSVILWALSTIKIDIK
jgi:hypothetical protein